MLNKFKALYQAADKNRLLNSVGRAAGAAAGTAYLAHLTPKAIGAAAASAGVAAFVNFIKNPQNASDSAQ